jgi:hypothetical protein
VQGKKKRDAEAALKKALSDEAERGGDGENNISIGGGAGDILGSKDEDVIF